MLPGKRFREYLTLTSMRRLLTFIWKSEKNPTYVFIKKIFKAIFYLVTGNFALIREKLGILSKAANPPRKQDFSVGNFRQFAILCTRHTLFVAHLIQRELRRAGFNASVHTKYNGKRNRDHLFFVICPQMFPVLPKHYVAFQMEQSINPRWFTESYMEILNKALVILDYSVGNIEFLLGKGFPFQKQYFMPIGPIPNYIQILQHHGYSLHKEPKSIDVLFYGDPNSPRRREFLEKIRTKHKVYIASEVFGQELINLILKAKLVINIHYYENALLETTRIHETLSCGTPIVSESSIDLDSHEYLRNVVCFTPIGNVDAMAREVDRLLSSQNCLNAITESIKRYCAEVPLFAAYFQRFLLAQELTQLDEYMQIPSIDLDLSLPLPRLCLSLSETPSRRKDFESKPTYGFQIFEGLRNPRGWVGCALSYKRVMQALLETDKDMCIICEDDAIFPRDFEEKLTDILDFLVCTSQRWDLFSGMIAHLHPDTIILGIEERNGVEYIFINKMTSTVMNIYSRNAMRIIAVWNETNKDPTTNTIDRYIERHSDFVTVTTLPFLVEHAEDLPSTLWDIQNTQYRSLITESERLLAQKVAEYKAKQITL